jgi:Helix-turn-helix domain
MNEFNPREFRRSLRRPDISDAEYRVAVELCEHANRGDPIVWPSVPTLAEDSAMTDRAVQKILRRLEDKGVIVCEIRSKGGRGKSSRWRLIVNTETVNDGTPFTEPERVNHGARNGEPRSTKPRTAVHPKKIEEEGRRGDAPAAWRGNASPLNDDDVTHPETWAAFCAP